MKVIWKYDIVDGWVELPFYAQILKVGNLNGSPKMWVLVNPETKTERRCFRIVATGERFVDTDLKYIDTFFDGPFVWHLFECMN